MPELPEVETIKGDLEKKILRKKISKIEVRDKKIIKNQLAGFKKILENNSFAGINRIGKLLIFSLSDKKNYLLIHLKMTGQLIYCLKDYCLGGGHSIESDIKKQNLSGPNNKYTRIIFQFNDNSKLFFNDLRRFGYLKIADKKGREKIIEDYGIEPLTKSFIFEKFKNVLGRRKIAIKAVLMNQKLIAGIGNIYADEILFRAKIRPSRKVNTLSHDEIKRIFKFAKEIIKKAIKYRGTTFSNYVDSQGKKGNFTRFLRVYGREGKKCYRCNGIIVKKKLAGRGTHYCPKCQK